MARKLPCWNPTEGHEEEAESSARDRNPDQRWARAAAEGARAEQRSDAGYLPKGTLRGGGGTGGMAKGQGPMQVWLHYKAGNNDPLLEGTSEILNILRVRRYVKAR